MYDKVLLLRDLTASNLQILMRERSFHSRRLVSSKGSILERKSHRIKVFEKNVSIHTSPYLEYKTEVIDCFITLVKKELQLYKNEQNVYNDFIKRLLLKPEFLFACYQKIQDKTLCNMTQADIE